MNEKEGNEAAAIRNAFSHNEYPDISKFPEVMKSTVIASDQSFFAGYFLQHLKDVLQAD